MSTKSINTLLTGALLLTGSAVFAQTTPVPAPLAVGVYATAQAGKICFAVVKPSNTLASVYLLAPTGETLYYAQLPKKNASFRQILDLHELEDGIYSLRIKQDETVIVKSIQLLTNTPDPTLPTRLMTLGE